SSRVVALLRVAERLGLRRAGTAEACVRPRLHSARRLPQSQRTYVALPQSKSEQRREHEEIDQRKESVLLYCPEIMNGAGNGAHVDSAVQPGPPRAAQPTHRSVRRCQGKREQQEERQHTDEYVRMLDDLACH